MTDRPKRLTRKPARAEPTTIVLARPKRKAPNPDPDSQVHFLLKNPRSALTKMDISDLINAASWDMLSIDSQRVLAKMLPPTAFHDHEMPQEVNGSSGDAMDTDESRRDHSSAPGALNVSVFTDPHFLAAAHTFQDHIYSNWMSGTHEEKVKQYEEGVRLGSMSAPWKDEVWERDNAVPQSPRKDGDKLLFNGQSEKSARAGGAAEVKLQTLTNKSVLRVGDVIAYKRKFTHLETVIEKDVIIQSIEPKTITVLLEPGTTQHLPLNLLGVDPSEPTGQTQAMTITSPTMLETGILDLDGRIDKSKRPNGNAWKCFTVWRWRGVAYDQGSQDGKGGRENHGTMFYLRNSYYHER